MLETHGLSLVGWEVVSLTGKNTPAVVPDNLEGGWPVEYGRRWTGLASRVALEDDALEMLCSFLQHVAQQPQLVTCHNVSI